MAMRLLKFLCAVALYVNAFTAMAGIVVGGTRVIFLADKPDTTISIFNKENNFPYLLQSWVDPFSKDDKSKPPFTVIPPVSRIEPGQEKILRILKIAGELPQDRESVFWLNIKNIPPSSNKKDSNTLDIAIKTRIKLFWRPAMVTITPEKAIKNMKWSRQGNQLVFENPNPIHINIMSVTVDGKDVPLNMIHPFETLKLSMPVGVPGKLLTWRFINDYGAISEPLKKSL